MSSKGKGKPVLPVPEDMEIAPGHTVAAWKALGLDDPANPDWMQAITIFETRIRRRFIDPVDVLIAHEIGRARGTFGFAILAIDCLLVETLQGFRDGMLDHNRMSMELFRRFLASRWPGYFDDGDGKDSKADRFYKACRCGIHHSGQTDGDFRVRLSGPLIEFSGSRVDVNRTKFHEALKCEFDRYLGELAADSTVGLRGNFKKKMDAICGISTVAAS